MPGGTLRVLQKNGRCCPSVPLSQRRLSRRLRPGLARKGVRGTIIQKNSKKSGFQLQARRDQGRPDGNNLLITLKSRAQH